MKKLVLPKKALGLCLFSILMFTFSVIPSFSVYAEKKSCTEDLTQEAIDRYGIHMSMANGKMIIEMKPTTSDSDLKKVLKKVKFRVEEINGVAYGGKDVLSTSKKITLTPSYKKNAAGQQEIAITLKATATEIDGKFCKGKGYIRMYLTYTKGGDPFNTSVKYDDYNDINVVTKANEINCDKNYSEYSGANFDKSLEAWFCRAKKAVRGEKVPEARRKNLERKLDGKGTKYSDSKNLSFKCDYKSAYSPDQLDGENYYKEENRSYAYGSGSYTVPFGNYSFHYAPDVVVTGDAVECDVTCEEAVTIEYGPPVASKAGLCFEYKVKVTSVVSCNMSKAPKKPPSDYSYCTPTPICTNGRGYIGNRGGPNEDFDNCIKSCDNGKYTDKCSKKCYNQVYGKSGNTNMTNSLQEIAIEKMAKKTPPKTKKVNVALPNTDFSLAACQNLNGGSCYTKNNGVIAWNYATPGRWYGGGCPEGYFVPQADGFCRHNYGSDYCHDTCWWSGCEGNVYLNPHFPEQDYKNNREMYDAAVKTCKAKASCTKKTAFFTMEVDYKYNTKSEPNVKDTLVFPYENKKDHLKSHVEASQRTNTAKNSDTTILDYAGCYDEKESRNNFYQSEWSFPGTWINNKTGEITYVPKKKEDGWQPLKDKFCIPLNANNVNQKWWNYYYKKVFGSNTNYSINNSEYTNECESNITKLTSGVKEDDIVWNIRAKTTDFGYFQWNINVKCFYALNSNTGKVPVGSAKSDRCDEDSYPKYRIRNVDLENLFPASDGSKLTSKESAPSATGRTPGFNWTKYANATAKNNTYVVDPISYIAKVQKNGYGVYDEKNLDYEFDLTPNALNALRTDTKNNGHNYTQFGNKGNYTVSSSGVVNYKSPLIRNSSKLPGAKYPNGSNLYCNNMINWKSNGCDTYTNTEY